MRLANNEVLMRWPLDRHEITVGLYYRGKHGEYTSFHGAIDMRCTFNGSTKQPVYAAEAGQVNWVQAWNGKVQPGTDQSYGNCVRIKHQPYRNGKKLETLYAHLSEVVVRQGERVAEGQIIGYTGATGVVQGAHLHFEVRLGGAKMNPLVWLDDDWKVASGYQPYTYGPHEHAVARPKPAPAEPAPLRTITLGPISQGDFEKAEAALLPVIREGDLEDLYKVTEAE